MRTKRTLTAIFTLVMLTASFYIGTLRAFPFPYETLRGIEYSKCIFDKDGEMLRAFTGTDDLWLLPVELDSLNPDFINATIAIEDKRFMKHHGFDVAAILRAVRLNLSNKRIVSGASTISMQVIRLLEKRPRTFLSKVIETVHAVELERMYSKEEILKLYFEIAPYGGNINGVKAASLRYFQKYPRDLDLAECALLAGLPQSPSRLRPNRYPERAKKRRNMVLLSMLKNGFITDEQYERSVDEVVIAGNYHFPFKAPHFARLMKQKYKDKTEIITTIDSNIQHFAEAALKEKIKELRYEGVTNGSIVIIENDTGNVRAMVGSDDFFSFEDCGQINGALSRRSPGSALKPFTYALAFDKGLYSPRMLVSDAPVQYSGYTPFDYDKKYRGKVTIREALVDSLNIPAVEVLDRITYRGLYLFLKDAGISTLTELPEHYGLSLTLGSCEVKLLELTNAYATLARLGVYKPYSVIASPSTSLGINSAKQSQKRLLSEGAAYIIADILSDSERLKSIGIYRDEKLHPKIAWKTGTSYGHRDAWTVAYNPEYTVGVWLGNFSGKPSKSLVGLDAATPVAMKIFDWMYTKKVALWYRVPDSIIERNVCSLTGEPVGKLCPHSVKDLYIKHKTIAKKCRTHKKARDIKVVNFDKDRPRIVSPSHGCEYFTFGGDKTGQEILLAARSSISTDKLYWFINGEFYNKCSPWEKVFWPMKKGRYKITCSDKHGRTSSVTIRVR